MATQPLVDWNEAPPVVEPGDPLRDATIIKPPADARYRAGRTFARAAAVLIGVSVAVHVADALVSLYGIGLLANLETTTTDADLVAYDENAVRVGIALLVTYIVAAIASLAWLNRLVSNVPALGGGTPSVGPTGAVVWWFVPLANLVKPYQVVAESWRSLATSPAGSSATIVLVWWLLFMGGNILGNIYARLPLPETVEAFNGQQTLNIASDMATVVAGVVWIRIILELERRSVARSRAVADRVIEDERAAAAEAATMASMSSWTLGQRAGEAPATDATAAAGAPAAEAPASAAEPESKPEST